jgi:hypothetical protein
MNFDVKAEKRNGFIVAIVFDVYSKKIKDFAYISKVGECDAIADRMVWLLRGRANEMQGAIYSRNEFNLSISALFNMTIQDDHWLSIETSIFLVDILIKIKDYYLSDPLYYLAYKVSEKGRDNCLKKIESFRYDSLSGDDRYFFEQRMKALGLEGKAKDVFPEVLRIAERQPLKECQKGIAEMTEIGNRLAHKM